MPKTFLTIVLSFCCWVAEMVPTVALEFSVGQVWSYKTRAGEDTSKILINKIEDDPKLGRIFHISITDVRVKNKMAPSGISMTLPHLPVSSQTLVESCLEMIRNEDSNPEYLEGYSHWRSAFEEGKAGVFTIPLSEIIDVIEATLK